MALARIITRFQAYSRELAMELLARGYAVEVVSPDAVPDNIADLELRVDAGPGDRLTANVEAHNGGHWASLEFVHHLKAPMVDFMRRSPELGAEIHFSGEPDTEDMEPPAEAPQLLPKAVSPAAGNLLNRELDPGIDPEGGARLIAAQALSPSPVERPCYFAVEDGVVSQPIMVQSTVVPPTQAKQRSDRSAGWPWHAPLTFASVVLLAMVLGFGMRRISKGAVPSSEAVPVEKMAAASTGVNPLSAVGAVRNAGRGPGQVSAVPLPASTLDSEGSSTHAPNEAQVAKVGAPTTSHRTAVSRKRGDLIAPDTVTYLDKRFEPAQKAKPAKPLVRRHLKSNTHGRDVIATKHRSDQIP